MIFDLEKACDHEIEGWHQIFERRFYMPSGMQVILNGYCNTCLNELIDKVVAYNNARIN